MECPPIEPHPSLLPFEPTAERTLSVFGIPVQLALVPGRKARPGHVRADRPALQRSAASRILKEETYWRSEHLALTPNKFPFARNQRILWMANPAREPDQRFWLAAHAWVSASRGTALLNNIGAAATIARAHAHLIEEHITFLDELSERPLQSDLIDVPAGCEFVCKDLPFGMIGVRGQGASRATALILLAEARQTATWNVIIQNDATWIVPRRQETPLPYFPQALGAAEFWGRWCYVDREPFEAATSQDLEQALALATMPAIH